MVHGPKHHRFVQRWLKAHVELAFEGAGRPTANVGAECQVMIHGIVKRRFHAVDGRAFVVDSINDIL